jgi:hypothetical protein
LVLEEVAEIYGKKGVTVLHKRTLGLIAEL